MYSHDFVFSILTDNGVAYMTLCEKSYSTQLAYNYLSDLKKEFSSLYSKEVDQVERPFAFIKFDTFIQKSKRVYSDTRTKRNIQLLKTELEDVQQIVRRNIEDVIGRGAKLDHMNNLSNDLLQGAQKLKKNATKLNDMYFWKTYGPVIAVLAIVAFVLFLKFYLF
jgi:vesicle transport protein SEC22